MSYDGSSAKILTKEDLAKLKQIQATGEYRELPEVCGLSPSMYHLRQPVVAAGSAKADEDEIDEDEIQGVKFN